MIAAMNHIEKLGTRSRALERELRDVHELPLEEEKTALMREKITSEGE